MEPSAPPPAPVLQPKRRSLVKLIIVGVIAIVIAAVALGIGIPATQRVLAQPRITLTDATYQEGGCGFFGPNYHTYAWGFNLVNTGDGDGFATVTFYVNNNPVGTATYFVPQHSQVTKSGSVNGPAGGCSGADSPNLAITAVSKA